MVPDMQRNKAAYDASPAPLVGPMSTVPSASLWRGWSLLLRLLGIAIAFVGGPTFLWLITIAGDARVPVNDAIQIGWFILLGLVAAAPLRWWWAILIVPIAFDASFIASLFAQHTPLGGLLGIGIIVVFYDLPLALGAALGTLVGLGIEKRLRR
jgi:hypothetical protein